ncbi:MAG: DNA polymerase III subunit beta [Acidithiobacillus sp.]|uniref:DNA polymerase III subunit beta n=1 Tax=Acidithiobacillus sp. TaxID=1872118 RepID=UPI003D05156B
MKIRVERDTLLPMLASMVSVADRRPIQPILSHLLVKAEGESLSCVATDLEVQLYSHVAAQVEQAGACAIPARKLYDICRSLAEGSQIDISRDKERIALRCGSARFHLQSLPAEQFPESGADDALFSGQCSGTALREALSVAATAMAQNDARFFLNGVLLEVAEQELRCIATDGHRLARMTLPFAHAEELPTYQGIMPRKAVLELSRLLGEEDVELRFGHNAIVLANDTLQFRCKLIDARYPDYRRVIPLGHPERAQLDRQSLKQALTQINVLSSDKNPACVLNFRTETLGLRSRNEEQEEAEVEIPVQYSGAGLEIAFNSHYLADSTQIFADPEIAVQLKDNSSSVLFTPLEGDNPLYIVMPIRL